LVSTKWKGKRRGWIKIHFAIDKDTMNVVSFKVTKENILDNKEFKNVLDPIIGKVAKVYGDKGYDSRENFNYLANKNVKPIILLRKNARTRAKESPARAKLVREIHKMGLENWKESVEYWCKMDGKNILFSIKNSEGRNNKSKKDNISIPGSSNEDLLLLFTKKKHGGELRMINLTFS